MRPPAFALLAFWRSSVPKPKEGELLRCELACLPIIDLLTCAIGVPIGRHLVAPPALRHGGALAFVVVRH